MDGPIHCKTSLNISSNWGRRLCLEKCGSCIQMLSPSWKTPWSCVLSEGDGVIIMCLRVRSAILLLDYGQHGE